MNPILKEYFSTSSSSSSSDEEELVLPIVIAEVIAHHQKNELYAENIVDLYTEKEFLEHFKVTRQILLDLSAEFEHSNWYPEKDTGNFRIPAKQCLLIFCWYATHEAAGFRDVADRFNVAISTLHLIIENVALFLSYKSNQLIKWPSEEEQEQILEDFEQLGFPGVLGCLDGSHVRIDKPDIDPESYINRKKFYSIQFQAVCDSKNRIRDVFIGYPGSVHDARVFKNSPLYNTLPTKCGYKYLIADSAYPCLRNLLTAYKDNPNNTAMEKNFNYRLSHCRIKIEHTFGMLKQKFRSLYHLKLRNITSICHFIRACCVLYNLTLNGSEVEEDAIDNMQLDMDEDENINFEGNIAGQNFRNYIATTLFEQ